MTTSSDAFVIINELETLRVISDPLRLKIFRKVSQFNRDGELCSVKQISDELEIPPAKLYYHFKLLEGHGLLLVAETHIVSGILEKLYRVPAHRISVSVELLSSEEDQETLYPMFAGLINEVLDDIHFALSMSKNENIQNDLAISRESIRLPKNRIAKLSQKLEEILKEMEKEENLTPEEDTSLYTFFYAWFPEVKGRKEKGDQV